jgi:putative endonuclease
MFFTYILYSHLFDKTYVDYTSDAQGRLAAHNHPQNKGYTKKFQPWIMAHVEYFATKTEAMEREKYFKTGKGRSEIELILKSKGLR